MTMRTRRQISRKRRQIGGIVSLLGRKTDKPYSMENFHEVVSETFTRKPFEYRGGRKVPNEAVRPVAHWLIHQDMRSLGMNQSQQSQLGKLLLMAERGDVHLSEKKRLPKPVVRRMDSIGFTGSLDELYDLFHRVMVRRKDTRADYTSWLDSRSGLENQPYLNEKVHMAGFADRYITDLFAEALDVLWAYKKIKGRTKHKKI
jgi:hypothetical protein